MNLVVPQQAAVGVITDADQGVAPSPLSALTMPESRTFWLSKIGSDADIFETDINRFLEAVVEELDPDGSWTVEQRGQYLVVLTNELDTNRTGLVSVWDFAEFTAEHGLRRSCMRLFLRLILTYGSRKMEAIRKSSTEQTQQQSGSRRADGVSDAVSELSKDAEELIAWMEAEGFSEQTV
eukprot:SAG11_NODE_1285_length_5300_cov_1.629494_6_plen_180_part_00